MGNARESQSRGRVAKAFGGTAHHTLGEEEEEEEGTYLERGWKLFLGAMPPRDNDTLMQLARRCNAKLWRRSPFPGLISRSRRAQTRSRTWSVSLSCADGAPTICKFMRTGQMLATRYTHVYTHVSAFCNSNGNSVCLEYRLHNSRTGRGRGRRGREE